MKFAVCLPRLLSLWCVCMTALHGSVPVLAQVEAEQSAGEFELTLVGSMLSPEGTPAKGVVVLCTAGGQAVTDDRGEYRLEARVPLEAESLQVTAVSGPSGKLVATQTVQLRGAAGMIALSSMQLAQTSSCNATWLPTLGASPNASREIRALAVFDDGNGARLYAGGEFSSIGGCDARSIAMWDGSGWSAVGGGFDYGVLALTVFDDGNGAALYAGGWFQTAGGTPARHLAKWDGANWSPVGGGRDNVVRTLHVFDDGTGQALYVGTRFFPFANANSIAKWDGSTWTSLGSGLDQTVSAMTTFDDGSGDALFVGGSFTQAGGAPAQYIAKWDGSAWSPLAAGREGPVRALAVFNDGTGEALFAGSAYVPGANARVIAKWDGTLWSPLGTGVDGTVSSMLVYDDGSGLELFVGGLFVNAGGAPATGIAKWNGSNWTGSSTNFEFSTNDRGILAMAEFDDGVATKLYAAGEFDFSRGAHARHIAHLEGGSWTPLKRGLDDSVHDMLVFDDGTGSALYIGGDFRSIDGMTAEGFAKWDGANWLALNPVDQRFISSLTVFDDGGGPAIFAGGAFLFGGGAQSSKVAKWDGVSWSPVLNGPLGIIDAVEVYDDGSGPALFVAGLFATVGGSPSNNIAKWNGTTWSNLGAGAGGGIVGGVPGIVHALAVYDDGTGPRLYVGGSFTVAGGAPALKIASWDGSSWNTLGPGLGGIGISAMTTYDDGSGEQLFVSGEFNTLGGSGGSRIASWDGSVWTRLESGLNGAGLALEVFDDGTGEQLFVGGYFSLAGGVAAGQFASWNGSAWRGFAGGFSHAPRALTGFDDGSGLALFVGGDFTSAYATKDSYLTRLGCIDVVYNDLCNGDGGDGLGCTNCPCSNNAMSGTTGGCLNGALASARLSAVGSSSVSLPPGDANDLRFSLSGAPANAFAILSSGDALAPTGMANPCFGLGSGVQALQYDGLRCAVMNTRRHGGRSADSNGDIGFTNSPWGGEGVPPVGIANSGAGFVAGQTRYFQAVNRDDPLAQCMRALNTSQAVEVVFAP